MSKKLTDWLAGWCLWAYLRLKPRRDARVIMQAYAIGMPYDGTPFVLDPETSEKVLAPEGCSWHMAIQPSEGKGQLVLTVDDPAFRAVLLFGEVGLMRPDPPVPETQGVN